MKNKRILSAVLASQLVLCGNSIFTPKAEAKGVVSETIENTIDVTFTALKYLIIGGSILTATAISTEVAMAICSETLCEHAYTPYALRNAGITIEGDIEQFNHKIHTEGYMPFHMWCNEKGVQPVCKLGVPVPGLYEYNKTYYFLVGNQGINLGNAKNSAIEFAESVWTKVKRIATETGSKVAEFILKICKTQPASASEYNID